MIEGFQLNMSKIVLCKVMLVDNVLDEIEWQREDHCRVLFRADAVQSLGGELISTFLHNFLFNVIHRYRGPNINDRYNTNGYLISRKLKRNKLYNGTILIS